MNEENFSSKNSSNRLTYHRRYRKGNRTRPAPSGYLPITTTIISATNSTALINSSSVSVNDLLAPFSYLAQYKYFFFIGLILLILLCVISVLFLIFILKCTKGKSWKVRRQQRKDIKRAHEIPDFLDDHTDSKGENVILLPSNSLRNSLKSSNDRTNGILLNDNVSNTLSLDPLLQEKIIQNNPPNVPTLSPNADDTSLDTLRGSVISSPSQQIPVIQSLPTPTRTTTKESLTNSEDRVAAAEAEKDDGLNDLDLKSVQRRYIKSTNNSSSNLPKHRKSGTTIEQSIRRQEIRDEEAERALTHGSNTNIYEKAMKQREEKELNDRKPHTVSQTSLVSRTSEDSCY
ncbi:hypothetical protein I4U23_007306 [Adineta vaga]|nr:hypothetical protein I4U23_007306 [Adineta vaga]